MPRDMLSLDLHLPGCPETVPVSALFALNLSFPVCEMELVVLHPSKGHWGESLKA